MKKIKQIEYFFLSKSKKIGRFIKKVIHNTHIQIKDFVKRRELFKRFFKLLLYLGEVAFTGTIIYYSITHFNWISCGILSALITYYLEWFVKLVKRKEK